LLKTGFRIIGWKRPLGSSTATTHPTPPFLLNHILDCHIYTHFLNTSMDGDSTTSLGKCTLSPPLLWQALNKTLKPPVLLLLQQYFRDGLEFLD